jgi:hypothetical protein
MKQLIKNKRFEVIKALVESKKVKQEWLEDLYSILLEQDTDVEITQAKYEIIKLLLTEKKYLNFELLTKTLNLDQQTVEEIANSQFIEFEIPIAFVNAKPLITLEPEPFITVKAIAVSLSVFKISRESLSRIFPFEVYNGITYTSFQIVFDKLLDYEEKAFKDSLLSVLSYNKVLKNFFFPELENADAKTKQSRIDLY